MKNLKKLRRERNIKQETLADYLGISVATYSRYESDISKMTIYHLKKCQDYFNVIADYLLDEFDEPIKRDELRNLSEKKISIGKSDLENIINTVFNEYDK